MYLFDLKSGKKKLAYGKSPEDALKILSYRLSQEEMEQIISDSYQRIRQRDLQKYIDNLG
ncbi:MAG: hypothetical protein GYB68_10575 [Chloroflexi bacterium]|nr:hypothetical protein [Chloroflexota bacterium]